MPVFTAGNDDSCSEKFGPICRKMNVQVYTFSILVMQIWQIFTLAGSMTERNLTCQQPDLFKVS
jgi:hypothetical protein